MKTQFDHYVLHAKFESKLVRGFVTLSEYEYETSLCRLENMHFSKQKLSGCGKMTRLDNGLEFDKIHEIQEFTSLQTRSTILFIVVGGCSRAS